METHSPPSPPIPRLRITRHHSSAFEDDDISKSLPAGPSRIPFTANNELENFDEEDDLDAQSTPKMPLITSIPPSRTPPNETPAARLRALLSRVPNNSAARSPLVQERPPVPPSEVESDFDPPHFSPMTPSIARESLKDLFSRALREPGDTPQKSRRRRNSIDISQVEASPRADRERAKNKGKRRSLSDEEADKPSRSSQRSDNSVTSAHAAALIALREKVERSFAHSKPFSMENSRHEHDALNESNESNDTATFLRGLDSSQATPPAAHSTPQRSLQLPSQLQSQSNLLEHDSEMQDAMKGFDSFEGESDSSHNPPVSSIRVQSSTAVSTHAKSRSLDQTPGKGRGAPPLSRQGSDNIHDRTSNSALSDKERSHSRAPLETPSRLTEAHRHFHKSSSGIRPRTRSSVSVDSAEDDSSSRTDSVASHSNHHGRVIDPEQERVRQWNRPHPTMPHSASSLNLHPPTERPRTLSHPNRPDHVHQHVSPDPPHHRRNHSFSSSDAGSPGGSVASNQAAREQELEILHEFEHGRERNWNAPHPKWDLHSPQHRRPVSPMPHSHTHSHTPSRVRTESSSSLESNDVHANPRKLHRSPVKLSPSPIHPPKGTVKSPRIHRPTDHPVRPRSPLPPMRQNGNSSPRSSPASGSRFMLKFPRNKTPLPPLELDSSSPERPSPQVDLHPRNAPSPSPGTSKTSRSVLKSQIPVKAQKKSHNVSSSATDLKDPLEREHEQESHAVMLGRTAPVINEESSSVADTGSQDEHVPTGQSSVPPHISNPTLQAEIPDHSPSEPESPRSRAKDEARLQRLASSRVLQEISPPLTPSEVPKSSQPIWPLSTPPRRPSFSTTRIEFQSPSPPQDLPDLPGLPFASDGEDENKQEHERQSVVTAFATPRPPGAWTLTPMQPSTVENRANSLPVETKDLLHQNGLVTPVASLSRAGSLPLQTPVPPGGWMATPNRKSILKVRFDEVPHSETPVNGNEPGGILPGALRNSADAENDTIAPTSAKAKKASPDDGPVRVGTPVTRETPVLASPRGPRKSPSIRVVDAFGREKFSGNEAINGKQDKANGSATVDDTSRNRTTVRIVDAMGREVAEPDDESNLETDGHLTREEALARVRKGLVDLASGLDEEDRSIDEPPLDKELVSKLQAESRAARDIRTKLSASLATVRKVENDVKNRYSSFRSTMKRSNLFLHGWTFWILVTVQLFLVIVMYRISAARARVIFLTTYYDPFYPDLHLYTAKPDTFRYSFSSSHLNPPRPISSIVEREGWLAVLPGLWDNLLALVSAWQTHAWEVWGTPSRGQSTSWPPT